MENKQREILKVEKLKVHYGVTEKGKRPVKAVDGISFTVYEGETFGIVGESGCGKSTTGKAIVSLINPTEGRIFFNEEELKGLTRKDRFNLSKKLQLIFQDSSSSLDPRFTIGKTIAEPLVIHKWGSPEEIKERTLKLMEDVGLRKEYYGRYPHEFSGGQRQRIGIARALSLNPSVIVCDEPVSALDVSIQAQILNLMKDLQKEYKLTYVFISHNLSVVKHFCDRIAVMYLGHIVELSHKENIFTKPLHPYTQALLGSIPIPDPDIKTMEEILEGDVPSPADPPSGCVFHTRCKYAFEKCMKEIPPIIEHRQGHMAACHRIQ